MSGFEEPSSRSIDLEWRVRVSFKWSGISDRYESGVRELCYHSVTVAILAQGTISG